MINFKNGKLVESPFPYIVIDNAFDQDVFEDLVSQFPSTQDQDTQMGGRKKLDSGDPFGRPNDIFHQMLADRPAWNDLFSWMSTQETQDEMFSLFRRGMREWECLVGKQSKLGKDTYVHLDWSEAGDGYWREVHTDRDVRIVNFLVFFNDKDWDNGDFQSYSSDGLVDHSQKQYFNGLPDAVKLDKTIEAKANRAVFFLSTPNSYHGVSEQSNTNELRKFIYGSWSAHGNAWGRYTS